MNPTVEVKLLHFEVVPQETMKWVCWDCLHKWHVPVREIPRHCPQCDSTTLIDINCEPVSPAEERAALAVFRSVDAPKLKGRASTRRNLR